jgi:hypothetical protein
MIDKILNNMAVIMATMLMLAVVVCISVPD